MANPQEVIGDAASAETGPDSTIQLTEVLVFLFLIVPSMALSFFAIRQGAVAFTLVAYATMLRDLALVALVVYFLWRNREPVTRIGWKFQAIATEAAIGLALFFPVLIATNLLDQALRAAGLTSPATPLPRFLAARGGAEFALAFLLVIVVAITEETIFRGYLVLRFQAVTRSAAAAVLLSSFVFSLGHGYEGTAGVVTVGAMGLVFAVIYLWRRSLVAPIVMHFLQDFIGIVLLPLLTGQR